MTTEITFSGHSVVEFIDGAGGDLSVVRSAQVSLKGANEPDPDKLNGLIKYLMREHHGTPFEHNSLTFYVKTPIFVAREFMRHRIASYNERSARYSQLLPEFWVPDEERPLVNVGTSAKPELGEGTLGQQFIAQASTKAAYREAWFHYETMLEAGIANEVARTVLPVGVYTEFYVTMNARGLMNFLSLRVKDEDAVHLSRPQLEIHEVAKAMEEVFAERFPLVYANFIEFGRVAP